MDNLFFLASKTIGMVARLETWLLAGLVMTLWSLWRGRVRAAMRWCAAVLAVLVSLTVFPLGDLLLASLEDHYPAQPDLSAADGIIVLGGAEDIGPYARWGGPQLNDGGERVVVGAVLAARFPNAKLVFTGGSAKLTGAVNSNHPSEMTRDLWLALGVDPARIVLERASRNTSENALLTLDMIKPKPQEKWILVTSAFHMPRSMETFDRAGWQNIVAWPVDFRSGDLARGATWRLDDSLADVNTALKEYLGLWVYRMTGK